MAGVARTRGLACVAVAVLLLWCVAAVAGDCAWKGCGKGMKAVANPTHVPSSNGCGNSMMKVSTNDAWSFEPCCDAHDICFDTCGSSKNDCDAAFGECMKAVCAAVPAAARKQCGSQAQMFLMGGSVFGCSSYIASQNNACLCVPRDEL